MGLVCGDPDRPVSTVLLAVDPAPQVVAEALEWGADLVVCHHPLLLSPVHGVAATTPKGRVVHDLVGGGVALFTAHTNADVPADGVNDALARAVGVVDPEVLLGTDDGLASAPARGHGRIGRLARPTTLGEFADQVSAALPPTAHGVRVAGDRDAGSRPWPSAAGRETSCSTPCLSTDADVYVTSDLRHHRAAEFRRARRAGAGRRRALGCGVDLAAGRRAQTAGGGGGAGRYGGDPGERHRHRPVDLPGRSLSDRPSPARTTRGDHPEGRCFLPAEAAGRPGARLPARPAAAPTRPPAGDPGADRAGGRARRGRRAAPGRADPGRRPDPRAAQGRRRRRAGQDPAGPRPGPDGPRAGHQPQGPRADAARSWCPWPAGSPSSRTTELEVMERLETAQGRAAGARRPARPRSTPASPSSAASRDAAAGDVAAEVDSATAERKVTASGVPADLLALYEKIRRPEGRRRRRGPAGPALHRLQPRADRLGPRRDRPRRRSTRCCAARSATGSWCAPRSPGSDAPGRAAAAPVRADRGRRRVPRQPRGRGVRRRAARRRHPRGDRRARRSASGPRPTTSRSTAA